MDTALPNVPLRNTVVTGTEADMHAKDGENYFLVGARIAMWDARSYNQLGYSRKVTHRLLTATTGVPVQGG